MKPLIVASTRPELIKLSPVMRELDARGEEYVFATTGQHYDAQMFHNFVCDLELRKPDCNVSVGSGTQAYQTSQAMLGLERIIQEEKPSVVAVEGDTNSVLSASLAAVKLHVPVAHVEAGLRSYDMRMPEEINRIIADHCSEALFAPTEKAALNLVSEGIFPEKIHIVGNTIVDATMQNLRIARQKSELPDTPDDYLVLTLHRAENVDDFKTLVGIVEALTRIPEKIVFPVHPRTKKMLERFSLLQKLKKRSNISLLEPLGYLDFLLLLSKARAVLTDSGGVQEEAIVLNVPCITLRSNTERPETVEAGGNILAGVATSSILEKVSLVLGDRKIYNKMRRAKNPFGNGTAGKKIVKILLEKKLSIASSDFTKGFWRRSIIVADRRMHGKKISDLPFKVLKLMQGERERFPYRDMRIKKGQVLEILRT